jgi:hypothetical protein
VAVPTSSPILDNTLRTHFDDQDPLWKLRHALAGLTIALLLSVFVAAFAGRLVGDAIGGAAGGDYGVRVAIYVALLAYVIAGAVVMFLRVARHETRPLSMRRVLVWFASLWLWPLLFVAGGRRPGS